MIDPTTTIDSPRYTPGGLDRDKALELFDQLAASGYRPSLHVRDEEDLEFSRHELGGTHRVSIEGKNLAATELKTLADIAVRRNIRLRIVSYTGSLVFG